MKISTKIIMCSCGVMAFAFTFYGYYSYFNTPVRLAPEAAKTALLTLSENPDAIEIKAVSKPDSVFGNSYISENEMVSLGSILMKADKSLLSDDETLDRNAMDDYLEKMMPLMNELRMASTPQYQAKDKPEKFSGWKVKIEYTKKNEEGLKNHSERWFIIDRSGKFVVKSFDVPLD